MQLLEQKIQPILLVEHDLCVVVLLFVCVVVLLVCVVLVCKVRVGSQRLVSFFNN